MTSPETLEWLIRLGGGGLVTAVIALWRLDRAGQERRAQEWKDLYLQEAADHAKTLAKAERLVEALEKRLRESSRPPAPTSGTSRQG